MQSNVRIWAATVSVLQRSDPGLKHLPNCREGNCRNRLNRLFVHDFLAMSDIQFRGGFMSSRVSVSGPFRISADFDSESFSSIAL